MQDKIDHLNEKVGILGWCKGEILLKGDLM